MRLFSAIITSRTENLGHVYDECADTLIARFKEREENVRLDILAAFSGLVAVSQTLRGSITRDEGMDVNGAPKPIARQSSVELRLQDKVKNIVKAVQRPLRTSTSIKTKSAIFELLRNIMITLNGGFSEHLPLLLDLGLKCLTERTQTLKLDALHFVRMAVETHSGKVDSALIMAIVPKVVSSVTEDWYKLIAEALRVLGSIIDVVRPVSSLREAKIEENFEQLTNDLLNAILPRLEALDIDQEIKDSAISVSGRLVANLGDHLEPGATDSILAILRRRLDNEVTRIPALRAIIFISQSPLHIDLSSILTAVLSDVATFLKQQSRVLKQMTLITLNSILTSSSSKGAISDELIDPILRELAILINDSDLNLAKEALKVAVVMFTCFPSSPKSLEVFVFPKACELAYSSLVQGSCQDALIKFFQVFVDNHVTGMDFDCTIASLTARSLVDVPKQSITNLAKCIAGICYICDASKREIMVKKFCDDIQSGDHSTKHLALLCIGELGQHLDISTSSNLKDLILACFAGEQEDIKMAAAFALGHLAVGNMTLYLPTILQSVDTSSHHPHQYFLLVALKHLITIFATMNIQFVDYIESVLPGLILHCKSEEESVRSMVSECIGALLTMHSEKVMDPLLHTLDDVDDKFSRRTVATSIRFYLSRHAQCSDSSFVTNVLTSERMDHLLTLLSDTDLDVRRAALLMVNAAIRYLPAIVQFKLRDTVVPTLLDIMHFKQVREVDLGPFKHKVDDGVPLRKASLVGIESIMDAMPNYLDFNLFMTRLIPCISDNDEIKTQSLQVLSRNVLNSL